MAVSDIACPTCFASGKMNPLVTGTGIFGYRCSMDHQFTDTETLLASNPPRIPQAEKAPKIQPGTSEYVIRIPVGLIEVLGKRFGKRLDSSLGALLGVMCDPQSFVVVGDDAKRFQDILGIKVPSADTLVGAVYALKGERDQLRQQAEQKSGAKTEEVQDEMDGDFVQTTIRIATETYVNVRDKAKFNGVRPSQYIQQILELAVKNCWL